MTTATLTGEYAEKLLTEKLEALRNEIGQAEKAKSEFESQQKKYGDELKKQEAEIESKKESIKKLTAQEKALNESCASIEKDQQAKHQARKEELAKVSSAQEAKDLSLENKGKEIARKAHNLDALKGEIKTKLSEYHGSIASLLSESFKKLDAIHPDK